MNLKREGIRDFQLLMKWRNRSYGISRSLLWEVLVGRLSYDEKKDVSRAGEPKTDTTDTYPWNSHGTKNFLGGWEISWWRETPFPPAKSRSAAGGTWQAFMAWVPTGSSMQNPEPWSLAQLGCHGFDGYHS